MTVDRICKYGNMATFGKHMAKTKFIWTTNLYPSTIDKHKQVMNYKFIIYLFQGNHDYPLFLAHQVSETLLVGMVRPPHPRNLTLVKLQHQSWSCNKTLRSWWNWKGDTLSPIIMEVEKLPQMKGNYWRDPFFTSMIMGGRVDSLKLTASSPLKMLAREDDPDFLLYRGLVFDISKF